MEVDSGGICKKYREEIVEDVPQLGLMVLSKCKRVKTPLCTFRAVPHMALQKRVVVISLFKRVSLQDRVKNL